MSFSFSSHAQDEATTGGSLLQNQGYGSYKDDDGREYSTVSERLTIIVQTVSLISVTPNETEPSAQIQQHQELANLFQICNGGNSAEPVLVSNLEVTAPARVLDAHFDTDQTGTLTPNDVAISVGQTVSPAIESGGCLGVVVRINSESASAGSNLALRLTARSTTTSANGIQQASGRIVKAIKSGALITGSDGGTPQLLFNGVPKITGTANQIFACTVVLRNSGDGAAQNIGFNNLLPAGLEYVAGTLKLDGKNPGSSLAAETNLASNSLVNLNIPSMSVGQSVGIEYQIRVAAGVKPSRTLVNRASVTVADRDSCTTEGLIMVDPFGVVFAGNAGITQPLSGASVTLLKDASSSAVLEILPGAGTPPNTQNLNPAISDQLGRYNFSLQPQQLGSNAAHATYYLKASAPGFVNRLVKVSLSPTHSGLFQATVSAADGQPIADGSNLVRDHVRLEDLATLAPNLPMFETHGLGIDKSVDKQRAEIGDVLTYTININNPTAASISELVLKDTLPRSFNYVSGTARVFKSDSGTASGSTTAEPAILGDQFTLKLGQLSPARRTQIQYRVRIGTNAQTGHQFNQATASGRFQSGSLVQTDTARVSVYVSAGVFSNRQIILGRVYEDVNRNARFDMDDLPVAGARVYLMNGQYVLTDLAGLYNFPMVGDGAVVVALDPSSLSPGLYLSGAGHISERNEGRLLRTPMGGGSLLHQDFRLLRRSVKASDQEARRTAAPGETNVPARNFLQPASLKDKQPDTRTPKAFDAPSTEAITPVNPGSALILNPSANGAVMAPGSEIQVRVALEWKVLLEINGKQVSENNIGETRMDHANKIATYTFAGLTLPPGPNQIRVTPIGPGNERGTPVELMAMGRGPVKRIEILTERQELISGGQDAMVATIRAWDQWGNPSLDGSVALEATNVQIVSMDGKPGSKPIPAGSDLPSLDRRGKAATSQHDGQPADNRNEITLSLKDGQTFVRLVAPGVSTTAHLRAVMLQSVGELDLRIVAESRPTLLVGLAEASFGSVPGFGLSRERPRHQSRLAFFFRGTLKKKNIVTLSYDSLRPLNRAAGQDRLFQLDPLERAYPIFGDSSTRFEEAQSNSRLYARLDRDRSYAMFGDFETDMKELALTGYSRKLTGVKLHLENREGSFITVTGARPGTSFARDVIPGGTLSLAQLTYGDILPGSETVTLEVRDRRNPEVILSTEPLVRSVDYNLDSITGQLFLLRFISTFDSALNLTQIIVTYEHRASGLNSMVLTGRGLKKFPGLGLQLGFSAVTQQQDKLSSYKLGGLDIQQRLPNDGVLKGAVAWSRGGIAGLVTNSSTNQSSEHNGLAYDVDYHQPVPFREGMIHGRLAAASPGFLNPFGTTVTPGSRRAEFSFGFKLRPSSTAKLAFVNERNQTERVDNSRSTFSFAWTEQIREDLKLNFGYDFRKFSDNNSDRDVTSNLFTVGAEWKPTDKLEFSAKREQNLGAADPTYPNQTTLGASYRVNDWAKLFFTQRIASAPIVPIADATGTGFSFSSTRSEMAFGVETKLSRFTSMTGRYQIDTGSNSTDSFAVIGLVNRLPVNKELSLELGYERGFHLKGGGKNFNSLTLGAAWQPKANLIGNFRYELRDRNGLEHLFAIGLAGRVNESVTALSRFQMARTKSGGPQTSALEGMAAMAIRPSSNDRMGLLFSYDRKSRDISGENGTSPTRDRTDTLSADAFYQLTPQLELSGRVAARFNANGQDNTPYVSTLTYLTQGRMQYRFAERFDFAAEMRWMIQHGSRSTISSYAVEPGYWLLPDLRLGAGYNFATSAEAGKLVAGPRRGFYFNISAKLSNLFDLFGRSRETQPGTQPNSTEREQAKR